MTQHETGKAQKKRRIAYGVGFQRYTMKRDGMVWFNAERATSRTRTDDLFITNELLYQLSYRGLVKPR